MNIFHKNTIKSYAKFLYLLIPILLLSCAKKPTDQTLLLNIPYHEARKVILENGWKPMPNHNRANIYTSSTAIEFQKLGFIEVDDCSGTGMGYCAFHFKNDLDLYLIVTTQEAPFAGDRINIKNGNNAFVIYYGITDQIDN